MSNYLPVRQAWLNRRVETALEPELPVFDAHHHLWDRPGWRYLFNELMADIRESGHRVVGTAKTIPRTTSELRRRRPGTRS